MGSEMCIRDSQDIDKVLEDFKKDLALGLPTREEESSPKGTSAPDETVCVANQSVPQALAAAAKYDPAEFQKQCKRLAELLRPVRNVDSNR